MSVFDKQEAACHSESLDELSSGTKSCNGAVELKVIVDIVFSILLLWIDGSFNLDVSSITCDSRWCVSELAQRQQ